MTSIAAVTRKNPTKRVSLNPFEKGI